MSKSLKIIVIIIITFSISVILRETVFTDLSKKINLYINNNTISYFIKSIAIGIPLFLGVGLIHNFKNFHINLGLNKSILKAVFLSFICTLPMLIGYAIFFNFNSNITINQILTGAVIAAFIEELYFRGILFGQIYRFTKIGFLPAIIFGAIIFAAAHLSQSQDLPILIGVFITTFLGAILFAWVYVEWNYNLWVSIFLHLFMNLFWLLFSVASNAYGNLYANIFRILTILFIIGFTIFYKRKNNLKFNINKKTLLYKSN